MAILKHIASHNARYSDAVDYLTKKHDEETGKPILDEHGQMIDREEFLIEGINCTPENFAEMCLKDCIRFNTNRAAEDVKTHQYVLSFDPRDRDSGLTLEEAQREGRRFAAENFPGHRCLVCTHPDGSNESGNIHIHIIINAVRFEDREPRPDFMRLKKDGSVKESEYTAGCKHQDTAKLRRHLNEQLQEYCRQRGYTVANQKPAKKETSKEFKARQEGQRQLDRENERRRQTGQEPIQKEFRTKKDDLRKAITDAAATAKNWDEFAQMLRTHYKRRVEERTQQPRIPFQQRQEMWDQYKATNEAYWDLYRRLASCYKKDAAEGFDGLRERKALEAKRRDKKNSVFVRREADLDLKFINSRDVLKGRIEGAKEKQQKLRLAKDVYQTIAKATKLALVNNLQEDAARGLDQMEELGRRLEGYWDPNGWRITFLQTTTIDLDNAKDLLRSVEEKVRKMEEFKGQTQITEEPLPIDVKISRGVISFKHPDLERWTRGKSLGADFELEAIAKALEQNYQRGIAAMPEEPQREKGQETDRGR